MLLLFLPALLYWESLTTLQLLSPDLAWWHTLHGRINEICVNGGRRPRAVGRGGDHREGGCREFFRSGGRL
ncbi:hypothetical protein SSIG_07773 [Streptomyces filamentosus NRRL 11379]|uniref:Predicted protein n=1 Tax=Streptomyces filamentosus NRRL 15998 TaxID=457431 RepID=D6AMP4_STRFL|nr:predicted protein [Streptomyces filamentosus NRRL 15998]EWS89759.1 hypothetical protein SSIG_07813 [Streptomyces filamentosus NRRL 11379]EWS96343.1 hypothetical protein SSIG_07773 [Streptomyces filamentosus NRRL 11379]